ncbi:MAG: hypothetical protein K8J08_13565 [Thermoanaerobaculia bacterium]|nr:hypothetical protein [Thermoanaerobaculia bacterium]
MSDVSARFPEVVVDLVGQLDKPVACVALVRRSLQHAGEHTAAKEFTNEALATANEDFLAMAGRWVTVVSESLGRPDS